MSSTGSTPSSTVPGTNVPPISFPGIASGIDWNSIIAKLTSITTAPETQLNSQMASLNAANMELIKINGMLASVQGALAALSQPNLFQSFTGTSSAPNIATAQGITGVAATPGTYVIQSTQTATATQILSDPSVGHKETDNIGAGPSDSSVPLAQSYAAITPTNGTGQGKVTVDGVSVTYDVTTQSLDTILANINAAVHAAGDATFTIGFVAGTDTIQATDSAHPISLGAPGDSGNLLDVLRLSQAQVNNTASSGTVTGTAGVGGINEAANLNAPNNAGFVTAVTAGTFTINGVSISVNPATDNLADVINRINNSGAGVTASYSTATGQITLSNNNTGPQSIVLSAPPAASGGSNFLTAAGLVGAGAQTTVGTQAKVTLQNPSGSTTTVYSNSNNVTTAIPGIQLNLLSSNAGVPFEVTVSQDTSQLVSSLNSFVSAYNTTISEINTATAPPVVIPGQSAQLPGASTSQSVSGGVLWNNADVNSIKDQLENMVAGLYQGASGKRISLSSVGLQLDSSYTSIVANSSSGSSGNSSTSQPVTTKTQDGTDGLLQPLDVSQLQSALQSDPVSVHDLFSGANGLINQIGTYLTGVTGLPTNVSSGLLGTIPSVSVIQGFENANTAEIQSLQEQIQQMQNNANQQADALRQEATSSEAQLAGYQALQQQLAGFFKQN